MKRILFIIPNLGGGGAEKVLVNLVNKLDRSKYSIEIKTLFKEDANKHLLSEDVKISTCFGKQFKGNRILLKLLSPKLLHKLLIRETYDIIVSYLEGPGERIVSGCTNPFTKLVNWIHVEQHSIKTAASSYRSLKEFRRYVEKFHYTAFVSDTVKKDYLSFYTINHNNGVIYNTNDTDLIKRKSREPIEVNEIPKGLNIFSIGRLTETKGFDRLIKAHKRILEKGINHNLLILGSGELKERLYSLACELRVENSVYFLGFKENPYKYLAHADLFVCSSRREGFSTAVTEALVLGIPIVSTLCSGAKELVGENGEYGIICANSSEGVFQGMYHMLKDPNTLNEYRKRAKERGDNFSSIKTVSEVERLFDSL